jgi:hypothetical protein
VKRFLFIALMLSAAAAFADPQYSVQLRTEVTPKEIHIGDVVKMDITVFVSSGVTSASGSTRTTACSRGPAS